MTKAQAKARANLLRRVLAIHRPVETLARRVLYAEPRRTRGVPSMRRDVERLHQLVLAIEWAVKDWRRA